MTLLLAHFFALLAVTGAAAIYLYQHPIDRIITAVVVCWANIVVTALSLSAAHRLGDPILFVRISMALAFIMLIPAYLIRRRGGGPNVSTPLHAARIEVNWLPVVAFTLAISPVVLGNFLIAITYLPNNYDSMTYHLPRVMFYLGQKSLDHFETHNIRQIFFPFDLSLLHLAVLQHGIQNEKFLSFINLGFWVGAGISVYRICRLSGRSIGHALAAVFLALTSTQILAQSTATTNDLPTGAALLMAIVFALRWSESRLFRDALMFGVVTGLAFGSKLTPVFFIPAAGLIFCVFLYRYRHSITHQAIKEQVKVWALPFSIMIVLGAAFAFYNIKATNLWMTKEFDFQLNKPFGLGIFWQTAKTYILQLFIEPLHRFTFDPSVTQVLNHLAEKYFLPNWNSAYAFSPLYVFPPDLNEDHVWFGFAGPFMVFCAAACLIKKRKLLSAEFMLVALGLGWFFFYFAMNKWSLYIQRYFVLPVLLISPLVAYHLESFSPWHDPRGYSKFIVIGVFATTLWFAFDYLLENTARPIRPLISSTVAKPAGLVIPTELSAAVSKQSFINMSLAGGNERIFPIMRSSPNATYTSSFNIKKENFNLVSKWAYTKDAIYRDIAASESYMLMPVPSKKTAGAEPLGVVGEDVNAFEYFGLLPNGESKPSTGVDGNILISLYYLPKEPGRFLDTTAKLLGLHPADRIKALLYASYPSKPRVLIGEASDEADIKLRIESNAIQLNVELRDADDGTLISQMAIPFGDRQSVASARVKGLFNLDFVSHDTESEQYVSGLRGLEGPYPKWSLPLFRWSTQSSVVITCPVQENLKQIRVTFRARLQVRDHAEMELIHNGTKIKLYHPEGKESWLEDTVYLPAAREGNIIELRDTLINSRPDWTAYLSKNSDVLKWARSQGFNPELGAAQHYEKIGRKEGRELPYKKFTDVPNTPPESLFYIFQTLEVAGEREISQ